MQMTIGILGDGQLAQMLVEAARKLKTPVVVLSADPHSPAAQTGVSLVPGNWKNKPALDHFFQACQVVLFENEFVNIPLLRETSASKNIQFFPTLNVIETIQQKLSQKKTLQELGIPTTPWLEWDGSPIETWIPSAASQLGIPFVLKWSYLGYDGKGVRFIRTPEDLAHLEPFFQKAKENGSRVYAEAFVSFRKELAMVTTHSKKNGFAHYPLVVSEQDHGICSHVYGPATEFKVSPALELAAQEYSKRLAEGIDLEGTFAVEFLKPMMAS